MNNVVLAIALAAVIAHQPQTSLQGRDLQPANDLGSGIESILTGLLGGNASGRIERVVVIADGPGHLEIALAHTGLAGARVAGQIQGGDGRAIRAIAPARVDIDSTSGEARLAFALRAEMTGNAPVESAFLRLMISVPKQPFPANVTYRLPKVWSATGAGGFTGGVTRIAPRPVGSAAKLAGRPDYATGNRTVTSGRQTTSSTILHVDEVPKPTNPHPVS